MRSMQWQLGILGTISAFAYRHRETKENLCRGSMTLFEYSCCLWNNVEKCGGAGQATDVSISWRMRIACWKPKVAYRNS